MWTHEETAKPYQSPALAYLTNLTPTYTPSPSLNTTQDTMANKIQPCNHKATSMSPAWCLRPPPTKDSSPRTMPSPNKKKKKKKKRNQSPTYTTEPSSPRIGCLGQVRRSKPESDETGSSSSDSSPSNNFTRQFSLLLIKRVISSKILLKEMDPPRPVERREVSPVSLWKRRCRRGESLKLRVQPEEQV